MQKIMVYGFCLFLLFAALSCGNGKEKNNIAQADSSKAVPVSAFTPEQLAGVFSDTLPCADCGGIATRLYLKADFTYLMEQNYLGIKDTTQHIFYDLGKWSLNDSLLELNAVAGDTVIFKITEPTVLHMYNQEKQPFEDSIAAKYLFRKTAKAFTTVKPVLVSGVWDRTSQQNSLYICAWDKKYNATIEIPAKKQLDSAFQHLKNPEATKAILHAEVRFSPDIATALRVVKFIGLTDGENCQ